MFNIGLEAEKSDEKSQEPLTVLRWHWIKPNCLFYKSYKKTYTKKQMGDSSYV